MNQEDDLKEIEKKCKGSVYQSSQWIELKKKSGESIIQLTEYKDEKLTGSIIAFERKINLPLLGKKRVLSAQGTPSFLSESDGLALLNKFKIESERYFYGIIAPTVVRPENEIFKKAGYKKVSNYTILINLNKTEEELLTNLEKKSARWGANYAQKQGVSFDIAKKEDIEDFYNTYIKTTESGGFKGEKREFIESLRDSAVSKLFLIKIKGKIVAGGLVLIDINNKYSILDLTAVSAEGQKLQAMPFLYWNLIKYSKSLGLNYFDLGGYDKEAKEGDKTYAINKFKENFGGDIVEQPFYATNIKYPFLRSLLRRFKFIRQLYNKAK